MNKYFEQTFNSIYKIFVENGLINKNDDITNKKKQKAFQTCSQSSSIQQLSIENEIYGNVELIVNL
jgi:hypothetical protein